MNLSPYPLRTITHSTEKQTPLGPEQIVHFAECTHSENFGRGKKLTMTKWPCVYCGKEKR